MKADYFENFSDNARIWIHGFAHPLSAEQTQTVQEKLNAFLPTWNSHGTPVKANYAVLYDQFLLTVAECPGGISGCSVDSFFRVLKEIRMTSGLDALESDLVYFRDEEGRIQAQRHLDFFQTVESGSVDSRTPVFDTLPRDLGELRQKGFERPFSESWHSRTYPSPAQQVNLH